MTASPVEELRGLLASVRLGLERDGAGYLVTYENERHPLADLPLEGIDPGARRADLLAVAAGLDAAVKSPAEVKPGESFLVGAPSLFPKLERARFVDAYNAVIDGRGEGSDKRLVFHVFGADLVTCYVQDEDWRMRYVVEEQRKSWDVSPGTIDSAARSHLYARAELYDDDTVVEVGDFYDGTRATILGDRYFHRADASGIICAIPGRDTLLIGPQAATADEAIRRYEASKYPLCPYVLRFHRGVVSRLSD